MASEWTETTLGEVVNFRRGHDLPKSKMVKGTIPVVGSNGVIGHHNASTTPAPCITIGRSGNVGKPHLSPVESWAHNTTLYIDDFKRNDPEFVFHFLKTLELESFRGGSAVPTLNRNHIHPIEVRLPPLPEQKAIAHILGSLDDKIELNRQMNETLEGMAHALFKSWFVDFDPVIDNALEAGNPIPEEFADRAETRRTLLRKGSGGRGIPDLGKNAADHSNARKLFPAAFQETEEMGWIPEGWEEKRIEDCIRRFSVGKKYENKTAEEKGAVPILDQGKSGLIGYHNDEPGVTASPDDPIIVFANHTCYMRLIMFDFSAIQNVLPFKGDGLNIFWLYEATKGKQKFNEYKGHWPDFVLQRIVVPTDPLVSHFGQIVEASYRKIYANELEIQSLTKLRDTLLPKLISGELRIEDAEKMVGEVA